MASILICSHNFLLLVDFIVLKCVIQIDVPASACALQSLIEASLGSLEHGWEVGWSLASLNGSHQSLKDVTQTQVGLVPSFSFFFCTLSQRLLIRNNGP